MFFSKKKCPTQANPYPTKGQTKKFIKVKFKISLTRHMITRVVPII